MNNYPTLRRCLRYMLEVELAQPNPCANVAEVEAEFERVLPTLRDKRAVELELSRLSPRMLRKACTTEEGTVPLSWAADQVLRDIADCIYNPADPTYDPAAIAFTLGLLCGYYQSDYQELDGFEYFHKHVPGWYEFDFFDGYMTTRKYGHEAYEQGKAHYSEVMK